MGSNKNISALTDLLLTAFLYGLDYGLHSNVHKDNVKPLIRNSKVKSLKKSSDTVV